MKRLLLLPLLASCVIGGDKWPRPRDLSPTWLVDRPRLLAVRAEPPEIRPGETSTFEALLPTPGIDEELVRVWFACPLLDDEAGYGCFLDLADLDLEATDPTALFDLGLIGIEPGLPPTYTAPDDLLDGLADEAERREGATVLVQVSALPPELAEGVDTAVDFAEIEAGYKRLVVSEATTPNHNPVISGFTVDDNTVAPGALVHLEPNQSYQLGIELQEGAVEQYEYLNSEGVVELRVEEPYATWYATDGEVTESYTLHPYTTSTWISPSGSGRTGTWYVVVRDRRGGMTWWVQDWSVDAASGAADEAGDPP